jgi:uncharacterized protein (TIGR00251 family)
MYIRVKANPGAKTENLTQIKDNEFEISVREPAERGEANKRICEILTQHFNNPAGGVKIINGHHSPVKLLKIGND